MTLALAFLIAAPHASAAERLERTGMFNGPVQAISEPDENGVRYVGGDFTRFSPWATGAALGVDATTAALDTAFPRVAPADGAFWAAWVRAIEPDGAGGVYVGGRFGLVDGQIRYGLVHILADGSVDPVWTASLSNANLANDYIADIALHAGVVYVVGRFSAVASAPGGPTVARANAAAFDATTGTVTAWNPSPYSASSVAETVTIDATASPARVFIGGTFTCINADPADFDCNDPGEVSREAVAVVGLSTGLVDATFDAGLVTGAQASVTAIVLDATGGWVYLGGNFTTTSTPSRSNAATVATDGSNAIGAWDPDPSGHLEHVFAIALDGSTAYLAGSFTQVAGSARQSLAAVSADPNQSATIVPGFDTTFASGSGITVIWDMAVVGSDVYIVGTFDTVGSETRFYAAKVAASDAAVQTWNADISQASNGAGWAVVADGSRIIVGGEFVAAGGEVRTYAAAVDSDGYLDDWSVAIDDEVNAIAFAHGRIYLGGRFTSVGGETRLKVAAVGTDGVTVADWKPDPNDGGAVVNAIVVNGDVVYFGGSFSEFNCPAYPGTCVDPSSVAAFDRDGRQVTTWLPALAAGSRVYALATVGSTIYIGGSFTTIDPSIPRRRAAAFDTDGRLDSDWDPDVDCDVYAIAVEASTTYLGGCFGRVDTAGTNTARNYAAAFGLDGTLDTTWDPDLDGDVYAIAATSSAIYLGGAFGRVDDTGSRVVRNRAAAFSPAGGLLPWNPNANGDGLALAAGTEAVYLGGGFTTLGGGADARSYLAAIGSDGSILDPWPSLRPSGTLAITVAKEGTGTGTVTSAPAGIDCGSTCSYAYRYGTRVTLTVSPAAGSTFTGWGGACSGTATTCNLRTDQARSVTAAFAGSVTPGPAPADDPTMRVLSIRRSGPLITVRVRVSAAGSVRTVGTVARRSGRAGRTVVCRTARTVSSATTVTLRCRLNRAGRALRAQRALRIRLQTVYRPAGGAAARSATRVVVLKRTVPTPHPVTG